MKKDCFKPGQIWLDSCGNPIQAHGGGVIYSQGTYYWFGENKAGKTRPGILRGLSRVDVIGINCYSSQDLYNWKFEGIVLPAEPDDPASDLHPSKVVERPKVIYNLLTQKYVMWMHIDTADYAYARAGVAISDSPTGPFHYLASCRPNGAMSRDMTLFQEEDGTAFHICSSENNRTMYISLLSDDYLKPTGQVIRTFQGRFREAPAIFKHQGKYYLITSGCTGWTPNAAGYAMASSMSGPWNILANPCRGARSEETFGAQGTFVLPVVGKRGKYIFMADIWNQHDLSDSRYAWLPIRFDGDRIVIEWLDEWDLEML
jgi:hypothetical protein